MMGRTVSPRALADASEIFERLRALVTPEAAAKAVAAIQAEGDRQDARIQAQRLAFDQHMDTQVRVHAEAVAALAKEKAAFDAKVRKFQEAASS